MLYRTPLSLKIIQHHPFLPSPQLDLQHSLGFVQCRRRFNVAVTRAQSVLVLVGNPWLLRRDECWRELIAFCVARGAYRGPDLDAAAADEQAR